MGTSSSKNEPTKFTPGQVLINYDRPIFFSGEEVTGSVQLILREKFPSNSFVIQFKGSEKALIRKIIKVPEGEQKEGQVLKRAQIAINSPHPEHFPAGTYTYPFSFPLEGNLPASIYHESKNETEVGKGKITYKIQAGMYEQKSNLLLLQKKHFQLCASRPFIQPTDRKEITHSLPSLTGLFRNYSLTLKMRIRDNRVYCGDEMDVFVDVLGKKSNLNIMAVRLELLQILTITAKNNKVVFPQIVWNTQVANTLAKEKDFEGASGFRVPVPASVTRYLPETIITKNVENSYVLRLSVETEKVMLEKYFTKKLELVYELQLIKKRVYEPQRLTINHAQFEQLHNMNQMGISNAAHPLYQQRDLPYNTVAVPSYPNDPIQDGTIPIYRLDVTQVQAQNHVEPPPVTQTEAADDNDYRVSYPQLEPDQILHHEY